MSATCFDSHWTIFRENCCLYPNARNGKLHGRWFRVVNLLLSIMPGLNSTNWSVFRHPCIRGVLFSFRGNMTKTINLIIYLQWHFSVNNVPWLNTLESRKISVLRMLRAAVSSALLCGRHGMSDCSPVPQYSVVKHYKTDQPRGLVVRVSDY